MPLYLVILIVIEGEWQQVRNRETESHSERGERLRGKSSEEVREVEAKRNEEK